MMHNPLFQGDRQRALAISRYMQALETGDLEAVARILDEALHDEALEHLVVAVNVGYDERWQRLASHLAEDAASAQPVKRPQSYTERKPSMQRAFRPAQQTGTNGFAQVAAAMVAVLLVSSLLLVLHMARSHQATQTGTASPSIHTGTLLCSTSYRTNSMLPEFVQPPLDWSARGVIATAYPLKTFSAQTCASQSLVNVPETSLVQPIWSPDGKRLLLLHGDVANVVDARTGSVLVSFQGDHSANLGPAVWASNETRIISIDGTVLSHTAQSVKVQVWDASTGALIRTAFTFADGVLIGSAWLSPNGTYLALQKPDHRIEFWNIDTGKLVSTTSSSVAGNSQPIAWSPNGASLAVGIGSANWWWPTTPAEVQVWSTASGQLIASFTDSDTFEGIIGGLAWSPNGKYLAESSAEIHIWDVAARQLVATFGKVATKTTSSNGKATVFSQITSVAWAPDSSRLASVTDSSTYPPAPKSSEQDTLNVWQLL